MGWQENVSVKSAGLRVCLWGIFQSGGSEDVVQLLEDWKWWSESRRGCELSCSAGGTEPGRMALQHYASMFCKDECWGRVMNV